MVSIDLSVESARHAVESSYAAIDDIIALNEGSQRWGTARGIEEKFEALCKNLPHVILLVGGVDGGSNVSRGYTPLLEISQMLAAVASVMDKSERPVVIYAGNQNVRSAVAELLADHFDFRAIDNVRPELGSEVLAGVQRELERVYQELVLKEVPHLSSLRDLVSAPLISSATCFDAVIQFMARQYSLARGVLGVDIGGVRTQISAIMADSTGALHDYGLIKTNVGASADFGPELCDQAPMANVLRWLPFAISESEARNRLLAKQLYPLSLPQSREDVLLEQAAVRETLALALDDLRKRWQEGPGGSMLPALDLIIASGGLVAHAPNLGQVALLLLDALQPVGLSRLVLDHLGALPTIGAVAVLQPLAAAQVLDQDAFLELGTVVAPVGAGRDGEIALRFKMEYADKSVVQVEVPYGSLEVIPLPPGQIADLELHPARGFDIGLGSKGRGGKTQVQGGAIGLIIDARGRPLTFSAKPEAQQDRVQEWLWSIGG